MFDKFSEYILPCIVVFAALFACFKKVPTFDAFTDGAKKGMSTLVGIMPTLIGITVAVTMLSESGFVEAVTDALSPLLERVGLHGELLPLALLSPLSGSGSLAVYEDILSEFSPDSPLGRTASVMAGSTETTFFAVSVYFGSVGIKNTGCTLWAGLFADFTAFVLSALFVNLLM